MSKNRQMKNIGNYMQKFLIMLMLLSCQQIQAKILVNVDRDPVVLNESFQLTFESNKKVQRYQPDFSPLDQYFTVLNNVSRNSTQIINGNISYAQKWIFTVLPKTTGKITIPAIDFGNELSPPTIITVVANGSVSKSNKADDVFLEVKTDTQSPYVQEQIVYTVKLYRSIPTNNESLSEPTVSGNQVIINKLGDDKNYEVRLSGKRYVVIERRYVIFPQSSGQLEMNPLIFQAQTGSGGFFNFDPFGQQSKSIVKQSDSILLHVKPIPDAFTGNNWLPSKRLDIQEKWSVSPDKLKQGEAVTRTLVLTAEGLAASSLPVIENVFPDGFKYYPDQPEFEEKNSIHGSIGIRREKMAVIPVQSGDYRLPAIRIPWWNTTTEKMEIAELPERQIFVQSSPVIKPQKTSKIQDDGIVSKFSENENNQGNLSTSSVLQPEPKIWKWISVGLFFLWLVTIVGFWASNRNRKKKTAVKQEAILSSRVLLGKLKSACKENNPVKTRRALLEWAKVKWPKNRINSLDQMKSYCGKELICQLTALDNHLYGKETVPWDGGSVFLRTFEAQSFDNEDDKIGTGKLEPLYKI